MKRNRVYHLHTISESYQLFFNFRAAKDVVRMVIVVHASKRVADLTIVRQNLLLAQLVEIAQIAHSNLYVAPLLG